MLAIVGSVAAADPVGQVVVGENLLVDAARIIVLTGVSAALGVGAGIVHRWYAHQRVPEGLAVLVGLSVVAIYMNTAGALGDIIGGQTDLLAVEAAIFNVITFFVAGFGAAGGARLGDRMGIDLFAVTGGKSVDQEVGRLVRTVGRVTTVEVPDDIGDIDGYDPVDAATKGKLAGQTLLFPRRLTVEELRSRFVERLRTDYGVGHVDVDFDAEGDVEYLALGSRESGIGPTLPPESAAVAVRADPPNNASPGDVVQLWTAGDSDPETTPRRVTNAEIRGAADDVVTLALDEEVARQLDTTVCYRLVTLPVEPRVDREFAGQLRAAAETMGVVTIVDGSDISRSTVGALDVAVVAVRTAAGDIEAIPGRSRPLAPGETVYAIGRPDRLRKLEHAASASTGAETPTNPGGSVGQRRPDDQSSKPNR